MSSIEHLLSKSTGFRFGSGAACHRSSKRSSTRMTANGMAPGRLPANCRRSDDPGKSSCERLLNSETCR